MLNIILIIAAVLILTFTLGRRVLIMINPNVKTITADEAKKLISENREIVILDVRTREEYKSGHIPGAVLIPAQELQTRINELEKYINSPILVYCASGGRSPGAVNTLLRNKFENIYHMSRGISTWTYGIQR